MSNDAITASTARLSAAELGDRAARRHVGFNPTTEAHLATLAERLTLEEKVQLLTGQDFWTTWPIERIGLRSIVFSDGPSGVRGVLWDERSPSLNLPSATALASSWDEPLAERYGAALAAEARRKGVDAVLGPTINLHRSPLGGRHFEAFSEDPYLTARIAVGYVHGLQANGVGATAKHYIANDYETERFTVSTEVDERTLRELYLAAFEPVITEANAWLVMSSYNSINGVTATESELLRSPLGDEWGFDGVVISDWTAVRSIAAARAAQDLGMPGPSGPWGDALVAAVRAGEVSQDAVDAKVLRLIRLAARVGAVAGFPPATVNSAEEPVALAREVAAAGMVLVRNESDLLPLDPSRVGRIAVLGQNADLARTQGGGSATVIPTHVVSPLAGIRAAFGSAQVDYAMGAVAQDGIVPLPLDQITNPHSGEPGMLVTFYAADGAQVFREDRFATSLVYFGGDAPITTAARVDFEVVWTPPQDGEVLFGFACVGHGRILADGRLLREDTAHSTGSDLGANIVAPPSVSAPLTATAGVPIALRVEFDLHSRPSDIPGLLGITLGFEANTSDADTRIAEAAALARAADVAVVVVGTNAKVESEGIDRATLALPGRQDDLVRAVAAANPRTVVVVNSGAPVELPWRNDVSAVLIGYFGGQEFGAALADVLTGVVEPGGRLPTTWPVRQADVPVLDVTPVDGKLEYSEGIHIGYRAWLRAGVPAPAYPFGFGLGYTTFEVGDLQLYPSRSGGATTAAVTVRNTGARRGKLVVQAYLSRSESAVDRPVRWLAAFAPTVLDAGEERDLFVPIPARAFAHWQPDEGWQVESGEFTLHVGTNVTDLPLTAAIEVT